MTFGDLLTKGKADFFFLLKVETRAWMILFWLSESFWLSVFEVLISDTVNLMSRVV